MKPDEILEIQRKLWRRSQLIKKAETPPAFIPGETLEEYERQLREELDDLIILFLDGLFSAPQTKIQGARIIEEYTAQLTQEFLQVHPHPASFDPQAPRITKLIDQITQDLTRIINEADRRAGFWGTTEGIRRRLEYLAENLTYSLNAQLTLELAEETRAKRLKWNTMQDIKVCELCYPLQGTTYKPNEDKPPLPQHPICRCWWTLIH